MSLDIPLTVDQKAMFNELRLQRDPTNPQDTKQLIAILTQYLHYPSDRLANIHREASRLGTYDEASQRRQMKEQFKKTGANFSICQCCCCIQQSTLGFSTEIQEIQTVSDSIVLFFSDIKYVVVWCFLSFLFFGIFAISTNILSYDKYPDPDIEKCIRSRCVFQLISLSSKLSFNDTLLANKLYVWESWMRLAMILLWIVFFILKSKKQKSVSAEKELQNITASDFAILIKDLPMEYNAQTFQQRLDKYANDLSYKFKGRFLEQGDQYDMKLTIVDFNEAEPYYKMVKVMNEHKQSQSETFLKKRKNYLKQWICFRQNNKEFPVDFSERETVYCQIEAKRLEMADEFRQLEDSAHQIMKQEEKLEETRPVIVSFHHNYAQINMLNLNHLPWYSKVFQSFKDVPYTLNIPGITIEPAPEPEDVIWENIGIPIKYNLVRRFFTFFATFLILAFSCAGLYVLSIFQSYTDRWQLSVSISLFISVINFILVQIIYQLSWYEKSSTCTNFEISVAKKAIVAQLINSVILNIFINIMTKKHFEKGGLAEDVFFLSITSAFLPPITRALNAGDVWRFFQRKWYSFARNKLDFESQREYNLIWQKTEYEIGYNYVFVVKTILFTAFFLSLQPIICLISCIGMIMMYYSEKYVLFYRSSKPQPRSTVINADMGALLRLSILCFALGNFLFSHIIPETYDQPKSNRLDYVGIALGIIVFLIPLTIILKRLEQIPESIGLTYQNQKLFLTSEYERTNPLTRQKGIRNFGEYISDLRIKYNKDFPQIISEVMDLNKDNPMQTISKMKASIKVHRSRYRKGSVSFVSDDMKSMIAEQSQLEKSRRGSITPDISLQKDGMIEAPLSDAVKMSTVKDESEVLNNSLLNDLIKPEQIQQFDKVSVKGGFNILSFIQQIIQQEETEELNMKRQYSLPVKSMKSIQKFAQKYKESLD